MNIAILVDSLAIGGAERQAILCVSELRKLGHRADLVYYRPKLEYTDMLEQLGVKPIFVPASNFASRCRRLRALLINGGYEVVHGFKMAAEVYAAVAGAWAGVPRRFGCFRSIYNLGPKFRLLHYGVDKLLDGWIVNSEAAAESMSRLAWIRRSRIEVLHNGLSAEALVSSLSSDEAKARLGWAGDAVVTTMVARLETQKNYPMLLQVAKRVISQVPETRFVVVGKGSLEKQLRQQALALGLGECVNFLGQRSDIGDILAATDISVLTSNYEGLPNVIIEAMAAGKPIVCTEYVGAREIMRDGENALLSPCDDVEAFAEKVMRLVREPELRSRLARNAAKYCEAEFSAGGMGRRLEGIYSRHGKGRRVCGEAVAAPAEMSRTIAQ